MTKKFGSVYLDPVQINFFTKIIFNFIIIYCNICSCSCNSVFPRAPVVVTTCKFFASNLPTFLCLEMFGKINSFTKMFLIY